MKSVVITGASSGVGLATAREFAKQGYNVALAARNSAKLKQIEDELSLAYGAKGQKFISIETDVCKEEDCRNLIERSIETFGGLDVLVNNAGISMRAMFKDLDLSVIESYGCKFLGNSILHQICLTSST